MIEQPVAGSGEACQAGPGAEADMEARLDSLATRWSTMVGWLQRRYEQLQGALLEWRRFEDMESEFVDWVESKTQLTQSLSGQETKQELEASTRGLWILFSWNDMHW